MDKERKKQLMRHLNLRSRKTYGLGHVTEQEKCHAVDPNSMIICTDLLGGVYMIPTGTQFHSGTSFTRFPLVALYSFTCRVYESYRYESYWYEFTSFLVPVRNVRTGMRFDHILYRYHVKEVRGFVLVGRRWVSELTGTGSECVSIQSIVNNAGV